MRITDNQQIMQVSQAAAKVAGTSQAPPKVGDVLNALVADLLEGGLLLNLDGKLVKAQVKNPEDFKLGEQVFLKVIQSSAEQVVVEKVTAEGVAEAKAKVPDSLMEALKAMELPDTPKNRATLEALNAFKLPLTQANVKTLQLTQSALETVLKQPAEALAADLKLKSFLEMGLKEIAVILQKTVPQSTALLPQATANLPQLSTAQPQRATEQLQTDGDSLSLTAKSSDTLTPDLPTGTKEPTQNKLATTNAVIPELMDIKPKNTPESATKTSLSTSGTEGEEPFQAAAVKVNDAEKKTVGEKQISLLLEGLEVLKNPKEALKTLAFLMKLDIPSTPQSLYAVGQVFNRTQLKGLLNEFFALEGADQLPEGIKKDLEAIKELLKQFGPEAFKSQETIKQLTKKLIEAAEQLELTTQKTAILSQDNSWSSKAVTDTFKTPTLPFVLSEFPFMINDKLETLELYVEKRSKGKKIDPEDLRIYLALTTEKLGQVGAMIEIKLKNIDITFDTTTDEVKRAIEEQGTSLEKRLEPFGYAVSVKAQVKTKPASLRDLHEQFEPISFTRFDKKV